MNSDHDFEWAALIEKRLDGSISDPEFAELESLLKDNAEARRLFLDLSSQHAHLQLLGDALTVDELHASHEEAQRMRRFPLRALAAAAALVCAPGIAFYALQPRPVATLVSNENASWESALPTTAGSQLLPGLLELKSGIATIRFGSGAEVVLEAPATIELHTTMRARLHEGAAMIEVPDSAIGFVLETPGGYAVDHGTQFAVRVRDKKASFEVLEGEISVHHEGSGQEVRLLEDQASTLSAEGLAVVWQAEPVPWKKKRKNSLRIRSGEQVTTLIRNNDFTRLNPEMLQLRSTERKARLDRRALFAFELPERSTLDRALQASIRFYVVQSGVGHAANLPEMNRFAVYGVSDESRERWGADCSWEDAPAIENAIRLGHFEIPRSKQEGVVWFRSKQVLEFLKTDTTGFVSFVIVRETDEAERFGLMHAFATDLHPEGGGPVLSLVFGDERGGE